MMSVPPSTGTSRPVTMRDSSEESQSTALATSWAVPGLPSGIERLARARTSSSVFAMPDSMRPSIECGVMIHDGSTVLQRIPSLA
jgi:hypothetical protein